MGNMQNSYIAIKILSLVSNTVYSAQYSAQYMHGMHDIHCTCSIMQSSRKEFKLVVRSDIESSMRSLLYLLEVDYLVKLTCTGLYMILLLLHVRMYAFAAAPYVEA